MTQNQVAPVVVGAVLASRNAEIFEMTVNNMLKFCEWILVVLDNPDADVINKANEYNREYYNRIFIRQSSIPAKVIKRDGDIYDYRRRWRALKGEIRDDVFKCLSQIVNSQPKYKIDILIFYDSDEIFTDSLPELLDNFWHSDYKAISFMPVDVVDNMQTVKKESKGHHVYVMKYNQELAGLPRRFHALYYPLCRSEVMFVEYYSVHLANLTADNRKWRAENWKRDTSIGVPLWKLDKSVLKMKPEENKNIFNREPDIKYE